MCFAACFAFELEKLFKMNWSQQMEVHYGNTGFPYVGSEGFTDFFEGLTHAPVHYSHVGSLHEQVILFSVLNLSWMERILYVKICKKLLQFRCSYFYTELIDGWYS